MLKEAEILHRKKNCSIKDRRVCSNYSLLRLTKTQRPERGGGGRKIFHSLKKKALNLETKTRSTLGKDLLNPIGLWFCRGLGLYT